MAEGRKLKILCIHGYRQNSQTFYEKTGSFRKSLKKYVDLVYITAPHKVPPMGSTTSANQPVEGSEGADENGLRDAEAGKNNVDERGWWFSREDDYFSPTEPTNMSKGFDASVEMITRILEDEKDGNFDGILGFSQGASLVSMLCLKQEIERKNWFKFAVIIAGFRSLSTNHDVYYASKAQIPTLHVFGDTDQVIVRESSEALLSYFENPKSLRHAGGHFVPASAPQKKIYTEFLDEMLKLCCSS